MAKHFEVFLLVCDQLISSGFWFDVSGDSENQHLRIQTKTWYEKCKYIAHVCIGYDSHSITSELFPSYDFYTQSNEELLIELKSLLSVYQLIDP